MHERPENTAAAVNALLLLVLPLACLVIGSFFDADSDVLVQMGPGLLPFAALTGWRTWVYAKRWRERQDRGWRAVAEAGPCGLCVALIILAPGILTRPTQAPPFVIVYGGAALILGLTVGLFLRMTALLVLRTVGCEAD